MSVFTLSFDNFTWFKKKKKSLDTLSNFIWRFESWICFPKTKVYKSCLNPFGVTHLAKDLMAKMHFWL